MEVRVHLSERGIRYFADSFPPVQLEKIEKQLRTEVNHAESAVFYCVSVKFITSRNIKCAHVSKPYFV